jgi:catechol 2,3-dioxygenase-like lactoylglutathione lyase family enzyme
METCLDVSDLARATHFYRNLFGFDVVESDERLCALSVAGQQLLILFLRGASPGPISTPGGEIPPHGTSGTSHVGFAIAQDEISQWEAALRQRGIAIESKVTWPLGGQSIYFRDPDGHLLELLTHGVWGGRPSVRTGGNLKEIEAKSVNNVPAGSSNPQDGSTGATSRDKSCPFKHANRAN